MVQKIVRARSLLAVLAIVVVSASAALPLLRATASNCPAGGAIITSSLTLNSNCSYSGTNGIVLGANHITLNCNGHSITLTTPGNYKGISNEEGTGTTSDTVENCKVSGGWYYGMYFEFMSSLTLTGNTITGPGIDEGVYLQYVGPATISGNKVSAYDEGFYCDEYCSSLTITGNTATGTSSDNEGFYFDDSCNLLISGNTATGFSYTYKGYPESYGFWLDDSGMYEDIVCSAGSLRGNTATGNSYAGFYMDDAAGFTLSGNTANSNGKYGFYDDSYGSGPFGVGNTYSGNTCKLNGVYGSYDGEANEGPAFLCTPQG